MGVVVVVVISTVAWLEANSGTGAEPGRGGATGSDRATGGSDELGLLLLSAMGGPRLTGLLGGGRFWRKLGSRYSDRSIRRPRLGRGGGQVVWCLYIASRLSPTCFHLQDGEAASSVKSCFVLCLF